MTIPSVESERPARPWPTPEVQKVSTDAVSPTVAGTTPVASYEPEAPPNLFSLAAAPPHAGEVADLTATPRPAPARVQQLASHVLQDFVDLSGVAVATADPYLEFSDVASARIRRSDLQDGRVRTAMALESVRADLAAGRLDPGAMGRSTWAEVRAEDLAQLARARLGDWSTLDPRHLDRLNAGRSGPKLELPPVFAQPRSVGSVLTPEWAAEALQAPTRSALGSALETAVVSAAAGSTPEARSEAWLDLTLTQARGRAGPPSVLGVLPAVANATHLPLFIKEVLTDPPADESLEAGVEDGLIQGYSRLPTGEAVVERPMSAAEMGVRLQQLAAVGGLDHLRADHRAALTELFGLEGNRPGAKLQLRLAAR